MSQFNDTGFGTVVLSATVPMFARVTAAGALAGATDQDVGVTLKAGVSGDTVGVAYLSKSGTHKAIIASSATKGAKVYTAASGKVNDVQATGAFLRGILLEAASADGDIVEILPVVGDTAGS